MVRDLKDIYGCSYYMLYSHCHNSRVGVVLGAIHTSSKQKVAIKKVPLKGSNQHPPSIEREVQALQECRGQYVCIVQYH